MKAKSKTNMGFLQSKLVQFVLLYVRKLCAGYCETPHGLNRVSNSNSPSLDAKLSNLYTFISPTTCMYSM